MKNLEQFVGRKAKGVRFQSYKYGTLEFNSKMESFVGEEGVIKEYNWKKQTFRIDFMHDFWYYPAELIIPQFEKEIIGYVINDEKYIKIIASLCDVQESDLNYLKGNNTHFSVNSVVEEVVKKFDLLDKCTPVYKEDKKPQLPIIKTYEGRDMGDSLQYGCAFLPKSWFDKSSNRSIKSMTLDSGVFIDEKQMSKIRDYLDSSKK